MLKIFSVVASKSSDFYELWKQNKQLKTMQMNEAQSNVYDEGYIHQVQPGSINKNPESFLAVLGKRKPLLHINCNTMHVGNRIFSD